MTPTDQCIRAAYRRRFFERKDGKPFVPEIVAAVAQATGLSELRVKRGLGWYRDDR